MTPSLDGVHGVCAEHTLIMVMGHSACGAVNAAGMTLL